jgi:hypothetical protein
MRAIRKPPFSDGGVEITMDGFVCRLQLLRLRFYTACENCGMAAWRTARERTVLSVNPDAIGQIQLERPYQYYVKY